MEIELTLEQLNSFLKKLSPSTVIKKKALKKVSGVLESTLRNKIFVSHDRTYHIKSKEDLISMIKNKDFSPPHGKSYNKKYLKLKEKMGEDKPHKFEQYTFWNSEIKDDGERVQLSADFSSNAKGFDYLSLHEKNRSVIKATFLLSWQEIIKEILETYKKEALCG